MILCTIVAFLLIRGYGETLVAPPVAQGSAIAASADGDIRSKATCHLCVGLSTDGMFVSMFSLNSFCISSVKLLI